jgi:hypothetical protein
MIITGTNIDIEPLTRIPDSAGVPADRQGQPADALRVPVAYSNVTNPRIFNRLIFARFSRVVKTAANGGLYIREPVFGKHFVTSSHEDTILNTKDHPSRAGLDRYHWFTDPAERVEYGFLIEG